MRPEERTLHADIQHHKRGEAGRAVSADGGPVEGDSSRVRSWWHTAAELVHLIFGPRIGLQVVLYQYLHRRLAVFADNRTNTEDGEP